MTIYLSDNVLIYSCIMIPSWIICICFCTETQDNRILFNVFWVMVKIKINSSEIDNILEYSMENAFIHNLFIIRGNDKNLNHFNNCLHQAKCYICIHSASFDWYCYIHWILKFIVSYYIVIFTQYLSDVSYTHLTLPTKA